MCSVARLEIRKQNRNGQMAKGQGSFCRFMPGHQEEISGKMHKSEADCLSLLCTYVFFWESGCFL